MAYECPSCGRPLYIPRWPRPGGVAATTEQRSALDRLKEGEAKRRPSFGSGGEEPFDVDGVWLDAGDPGESGE